MSKIKITAENNIQFEAEGNDLFVQQERKAFVDMISDKSTIKTITALQETLRPVKEITDIQSDVVVIYDNAGIPSIMHKFTKTTNKELFGGSDKTNAAFIIGGKEYDEIYISIYANTMINGKPYSLPFVKPATGITNDEAAKACFSKGDGWHLLTAPEWGLLANISLKNGTMPHGNTNCGRYNNTDEKGELYDSGRTLTGSGPAKWTHDHTLQGVHDLCGNIWEMVRGLRLMNGAIEVSEENNAALNIDLSEKSNLWKAVQDNNKKINISVNDEHLTFTTDEISEGCNGFSWENIVFECNITEQLKELALYNGEPNTYIWADTEGERVPFRGGGWSDGASSGVFYTHLADARSYVSTSIGFRSAFFRKTAN